MSPKPSPLPTGSISYPNWSIPPVQNLKKFQNQRQMPMSMSYPFHIYRSIHLCMSFCFGSTFDVPDQTGQLWSRVQHDKIAESKLRSKIIQEQKFVLCRAPCRQYTNCETHAPRWRMRMKRGEEWFRKVQIFFSSLLNCKTSLPLLSSSSQSPRASRKWAW